MKSKSAVRETIGPLKNGNKLIYDDKEMSDILNNYFASVFTQENMSNIPFFSDRHEGSSVDNLVVTRHD